MMKERPDFIYFRENYRALVQQLSAKQLKNNIFLSETNKVLPEVEALFSPMDLLEIKNYLWFKNEWLPQLKGYIMDDKLNFCTEVLEKMSFIISCYKFANQSDSLDKLKLRCKEIQKRLQLTRMKIVLPGIQLTIFQFCNSLPTLNFLSKTI